MVSCRYYVKNTLCSLIYILKREIVKKTCIIDSPLWFLIERNAGNISYEAPIDMSAAAPPGYMFKEESSTYNKVSVAIPHLHLKMYCNGNGLTEKIHNDHFFSKRDRMHPIFY